MKEFTKDIGKAATIAVVGGTTFGIVTAVAHFGIIGLRNTFEKIKENRKIRKAAKEEKTATEETAE